MANSGGWTRFDNMSYEEYKNAFAVVSGPINPNKHTFLGKKSSINVRAPKKRRRRPGEVAGRSVSIRWFCYECNGYDSDGLGSVAAAVRECTAVECPLWPWRNGKLDEEP